MNHLSQVALQNLTRATLNSHRQQLPFETDRSGKDNLQIVSAQSLAKPIPPAALHHYLQLMTEETLSKILLLLFTKDTQLRSALFGQ